MRFYKTNEERARRGSDIMTLSATKNADVAESLCWTGACILSSYKILLYQLYITSYEVQGGKLAAAARKVNVSTVNPGPA